MRRYLFTAVVFVLWIVGFYLATDFSGRDLVNALSDVELWSVAAGYAFYGMAVLTGIFILYRALKVLGITPPIKGVSKAWVFGSFLDNIAPTITPIGEASMAFFLERFYRMSYTKTLAAIGIYVSSWGISVSLFSIVAAILAGYFGTIPAGFEILVAIVIAVFSLITMGWLFLLTRKALVRRIICKLMGIYNAVYNKIKRRKVTYEECLFDLEFERSYGSLSTLMKDKKNIAISVMLFIIPQLGHVMCLYVLILGFGAEISFFAVLGLHIVASVVGLLSLVPSGLGIYEGVSIGTLVLSLGVPQGAAFGAVFIYRLIFVWTTNLAGGIIGIAQGIENPGKMVKP